MFCFGENWKKTFTFFYYSSNYGRKSGVTIVSMIINIGRYLLFDYIFTINIDTHLHKFMFFLLQFHFEFVLNHAIFELNTVLHRVNMLRKCASFWYVCLQTTLISGLMTPLKLNDTVQVSISWCYMWETWWWIYVGLLVWRHLYLRNSVIKHNFDICFCMCLWSCTYQ